MPPYRSKTLPSFFSLGQSYLTSTLFLALSVVPPMETCTLGANGMFWLMIVRHGSHKSPVCLEAFT